jgi:hypothetical protein
VWLGVSGNLIYGLANKPVAPAHLVYIGVVTRVQSNNGEIYVKIQNGFELQELHNVLISSVANNEGLFYESATTLWKNKSIATVLGYTPISLTSLSGVSPLSYNNTTGAFSIAQATTSANGYLSSTDWNIFNGKQAALNGTGFVKATGTTISYDNSAYITLSSLGATSPLIYSSFSGNFSIDKADTSLSGYLSATDWNTFNNKQASGSYITALSGEATASGPGSAAVTLSTSAVTGKLLTGVNITGGSISATDSILVAFGKVQNQINGVLGGAIYQSTWNASTNSPTLTSGTGTKGYYYIVSVAGSTNLDGITDWKVGDWAIFNGATWDKVDNTDAVSSVNGYTGAVSLTTSDITEGSRLYYTEVRVSANTDVAANTAARHAAVTIGTANGLSLSTQALSLGLASTSATGALSSTDWNTFNLKQAALSGTGFVKISGSTISYDNSTYLTTSSAASTYLALSGGIMTGQIVLKESSSSTDYTKGLSFPNDPFGGGGDTAGLRLYASSGENIVLELYVGNDGGSDTINFATGVGGTANNDAVTINGNKIWNAANLTPQTQLNGTGFVKASGTTISYDNSTYLTGNQTITLSGDISGSGATAITTTIGALKVTNAMLAGSIDLTTKVTGLLPDGNISSASTWNAKQAALNGTGFVKISGTTISYDNSTYLTTSAASSTYLPLAGGTLTGPLGGTSASFSSTLTAGDLISTSYGTARIQVTSTTNSVNSGFRLGAKNSSGTTKNAGLYYFSGTTNDNTYLSLSANDNDFQFNVLANGNVGIGTTSTSYKLDVSASSMIRGTLAIDNNGIDASPTEYLRFERTSQGSANYFNSIYSSTGSGSNTMQFRLSGTGGTQSTIMSLNGTGNVGIGTNDPVSETNHTSLTINGTSISRLDNMVGGIKRGLIAATTSSYLVLSQSAIPLILGTNDIERMRITSDGNTEFVKLNLAGITNSISNTLKFRNTQTNAQSVILGTIYTTSIGSWGGDMVFTTHSANGSPDDSTTERMRIDSSGAIVCTSSVTATSFFESSDSRLKTLIHDNYQTKGIASITPKLYTKNGKVELGYYAQDFVGILDSAVSKGSDDMLSLSYREVLVAKVYALEQEIKDLKAKMN